MKLPRLSIREMTMIVAIIALAIAWWAEHRARSRLAFEHMEAEMWFTRETALVRELTEQLGECLEGRVRDKAELQVRESADQ
jgi:hypothetical protein